MLFLSDEREGEDEQAGEYLLVDSASCTGTERTAEVSYRRLSAGESRGLVTAKKAKERRRRRRKKKGKTGRRESGRAGEREKRIAHRAQNGLRILSPSEEKRGEPALVDYWSHLKCVFKL